MTTLLTGSDGTGAIYMRARDALGNTTSDATDTIILDTTYPTFTGVVKGGIYT